MDQQQLVALVTCPVDEADKIAAELVARELVACVNVIPLVRSVYRWEGEVNTDDESLLVIKTTADRITPIDDCLREVHPYDVYELIASEIKAGSEPYLSWILAETGH